MIPAPPDPALLTLGQLTIRDERAFRHVPLYAPLKARLIRDGARFHISRPGTGWQRALFLNLSFWNAAAPSDILEDASIDADVVAHAAWHHLARAAFPAPAPGQPMSTDALFFGESIASAFDLYLAGRLLRHAPSCGFVKSQVPAMAQVAEDAGTSREEFGALLAAIAEDPARAFEDLRQLLFDAAARLLACSDAAAAERVFADLAPRRFSMLLHHYELATWVLYARAYGPRAADGQPDHRPDPAIRAADQALRDAPVSLDWLAAQWLGQAPGDGKA